MLRFCPRHSARGCEGTHQSGPDRSRPRPDGRRAGVREQGKIVCGTGVAIRKVPSRPCSTSLRKRLYSAACGNIHKKGTIDYAEGHPQLKGGFMDYHLLFRLSVLLLAAWGLHRSEEHTSELQSPM